PAMLVALGKIGDPRAVPVVTGALRDKNYSTVICALWVVGAMRIESARSEVLPLLTARSVRVRGATLEALGRLGNPEDLSLLVPALSDTDPWIRRGATLGLGYLGRPEAASPLLPLLRDPDPEVRLGTVWALGVIGARAAIPEMLRLLEEEILRWTRTGSVSPSGVDEGTVVAEGEGAVRLISDAKEILLDTLLLSLARLAELEGEGLRLRMRESLGRLPPELQELRVRLPQAEPRRVPLQRLSRRELVEVLPSREAGRGPGRVPA
ncbi:MAG: HEAT repeat domain-containing protein, partial [Candidatus Thermoplasmatota archaeon]|nr:HEAT repeat domain-containing protein [Candidatus Thermoplasmatota archaeon]